MSAGVNVSCFVFLQVPADISTCSDDLGLIGACLSQDLSLGSSKASLTPFQIPGLAADRRGWHSSMGTAVSSSDHWEHVLVQRPLLGFSPQLYMTRFIHSVSVR